MSTHGRPARGTEGGGDWLNFVSVSCCSSCQEPNKTPTVPHFSSSIFFSAAMLNALLQMTPEQIDALPALEKAQAQAIINMFRQGQAPAH